LPGPATQGNGWTIPCHLHTVEETVGKYVFLVGEEGLESHEHKVSAVLTASGEVAPGTFPLAACADNHGTVRLMFGNTAVPFLGLRFDESLTEVADLDGVITPTTPCSEVSRDSSRRNGYEAFPGPRSSSPPPQERTSTEQRTGAQATSAHEEKARERAFNQTKSSLKVQPNAAAGRPARTPAEQAPNERVAAGIYCLCCTMCLNSEMQYQDHLIGKRHGRMMKAAAKQKKSTSSASKEQHEARVPSARPAATTEGGGKQPLH
jgi:hypothetical protein